MNPAAPVISTTDSDVNFGDLLLFVIDDDDDLLLLLSEFVCNVLSSLLLLLLSVVAIVVDIIIKVIDSRKYIKYILTDDDDGVIIALIFYIYPFINTPTTDAITMRYSTGPSITINRWFNMGFLYFSYSSEYPQRENRSGCTYIG